MNRRELILATSALALTAGCGRRTGDVLDVAYLNCDIWTGVLGAPRADALGLISNKIAAIGKSAVQARTGKRTRIIDLAGAFVMPGFIDPHVHFLRGSLALSQPDLREVRASAEFIRRVGEAASKLKPGQWLQGGAWDHILWGGDLPTREWIDAVTPHTPVALSRVDLHSMLLNSKALELAGIDRKTPDVPGGVIVRDSKGQPTGIVKEAAIALVKRAIPPPSDAEIESAFTDGIAFALSKGVTQAHVAERDWSTLHALRRMRSRGETDVRFYAFVGLRDWQQLATLIAEESRGDDWVRWGGVKELVDGSLSSATAFFHEDFTDAPGNHGLTIFPRDELRAWIGAADAAKLHVATHAIGDAANDLLLDIYAEVAAANGPRDRRFRIEHAQHLSAAAIQRFAKQGVIASMQPYFAIDDGRWAVKRLGAERIQRTYAFKSLLDAGARVSFGTDWPVAPLDPLQSVAAAVLRQTLDGANPNGWLPEQKLSVEQTLHAYTAANAYAGFQEDRLGTLETGKLADFVVLAANPLTVDPARIAGLKVLQTVVDGKPRYAA